MPQQRVDSSEHSADDREQGADEALEKLVVKMAMDGDADAAVLRLLESRDALATPPQQLRWALTFARVALAAVPPLSPPHDASSTSARSYASVTARCCAELQRAVRVAAAVGADDGTLRVLGNARAALGVVLVNTGKFEAAARELVLVQLCDADVRDVATPRDVAICAGVAMLASFTRVEMDETLRCGLLGELLAAAAPAALRDAIEDFRCSRFEMLMKTRVPLLKAVLRDNVHTKRFVDEIVRRMRYSALCVFVGAFVAIEVKRVADVFALDVEEMQRDLGALVRQGRVQARIDHRAGVVYRAPTTMNAFDSVVRVANDAADDAAAILLRCNLLRSGVVVLTADADAVKNAVNV